MVRRAFNVYRVFRGCFACSGREKTIKGERYLNTEPVFDGMNYLNTNQGKGDTEKNEIDLARSKYLVLRSAEREA